MPILKCPLGTKCTLGQNGGVWETEDVNIEHALKVQDQHMKYAHPETGDGASGPPAQLSAVMNTDNLNVNKGVQGGNFVNSHVTNPVINIHAQEGLDTFDRKYHKIRVIGNGSFGVTWLVKLKPGIDQFAMKEITCSEKDIVKGKNEVEILKKCLHKHIVSYIEDFYEDSRLLIIMEYCSGGDLAEFIDAQTKILNLHFIIEWVIQLTSGVCFIHGKKIIHRDLKPENIFLTLEKKLKIGDFGIAKGLSKTSGLASTRNAGTLMYMAPEILGGDKYNTMADMWSLGIIIFEIITLKRPFHGHDWFQAICKVHRVHTVCLFILIF